MLDVKHVSEEVIWAYDFRFSPEVFWYPIIFVFYFNFFGEIGYQKTSGENLNRRPK